MPGQTTTHVLTCRSQRDIVHSAERHQHEAHADKRPGIVAQPRELPDQQHRDHGAEAARRQHQPRLQAV